MNVYTQQSAGHQNSIIICRVLRHLGILAEGGKELRVRASGQDVVELGLVSSQFLLPGTVELLGLSGGLGHVRCRVFLTSTLNNRGRGVGHESHNRGHLTDTLLCGRVASTATEQLSGIHLPS